MALNKCCRLFVWDLHYSKFCLWHKDWRAFTYTPWLPYRWYFQLLYIIYRWILAVYFFVWLFVGGFDPINGEAKYFIFLTNWAILGFTAYLVWTAFSTTIHYLLVQTCCKQKYDDDSFNHGSSEYEFEKPQGCCGLKSNGICWYHMIHWLLFTIGAEGALTISILYWGLIYGPSHPLNGVNLNTHLINAIVALIDIFISGVPVSPYHFIYMQLFYSAYVVFTGIYHAADGTNVAERPYVYSVLDYGNDPGTAVGIIFGCILVYVPVIHLVFYLLYLARYWLLYFIYCRCTRQTVGSGHTQLEGGESQPPTSYSAVEMKDVKSEP